MTYTRYKYDNIEDLHLGIASKAHVNDIAVDDEGKVVDVVSGGDSVECLIGNHVTILDLVCINPPPTNLTRCCFQPDKHSLVYATSEHNIFINIYRVFQ